MVSAARQLHRQGYAYFSALADIACIKLRIKPGTKCLVNSLCRVLDCTNMRLVKAPMGSCSQSGVMLLLHHSNNNALTLLAH